MGQGRAAVVGQDRIESGEGVWNRSTGIVIGEVVAAVDDRVEGTIPTARAVGDEASDQGHGADVEDAAAVG